MKPRQYRIGRSNMYDRIREVSPCLPEQPWRDSLVHAITIKSVRPKRFIDAGLVRSDGNSFGDFLVGRVDAVRLRLADYIRMHDT